MSLSREDFIRACEEYENVRERLVRLLGFAPITSNHYGGMRMYNQIIDSETPDEKLLEIRAQYLKWKEGVQAICAENKFFPDNEKFNEMFHRDCMYGTLCFVHNPVDIYGDVEEYRLGIMGFIIDEEREKRGLPRVFPRGVYE